VIDTFLAGTGELADPAALSTLRVGARVGLRLGRPGRPGTPRHLVEVRTEDGRALGYLPPGDAETVAGLLAGGAAATARVRGLVPAFQRPRIQLVVELACTGSA
jgi:hypothetical protein